MELLGPSFLHCKWHFGWYELPETVCMRVKLLALCLASPRQGEDCLPRMPAAQGIQTPSQSVTTQDDYQP